MEIDQLKQELVQEIKTLADDLAKSNSFVGLLSNEIKFRSLHEKFINLKFLERKHIGLEIFDQPIPVSSDKEEIFKTSENRYDDEELVEFEFKNDKHTADNVAHTGIEKEEIPEKIVHDNSEILDAESVHEVVIENHEIADKVIDETSNYKTKIEEISDDFSDLLPKKQFPKIQLDFNDRIAFLNQLFDGDSESMELVMNTLNHMESLSDSKNYLKDLKKEMDWRHKDEYVERLVELVEKRFD